MHQIPKLKPLEQIVRHKGFFNVAKLFTATDRSSSKGVKSFYTDEVRIISADRSPSRGRNLFYTDEVPMISADRSPSKGGNSFYTAFKLFIADRM